ncbi:Xylanase inhibitor, C-terminal [Dillenia turbinata]|uniref:Xylanase inhibitor, C-terminal n=1 Tax=Dillenia turbinata TaxID=194707 RepID=A0AAN8ZCT5_9MAGN
MYGGGQSYASGYILTDEMTFEAVLENGTQITSSTPITFGCNTKLEGQLAANKKFVDGILGLGRQDISVLSQLASTGEIPWVFSHCLCSAGIGGGFLVLGEVLDKTLTYTPLRPNKDHYIIALTSIALNGQELPIDHAVYDKGRLKGAVIDSGTTLAYLVDDVYYPFSHAVNAIASQAGIPPQLEEDLCYWMPIRYPQQVYFFNIWPSNCFIKARQPVPRLKKVLKQISSYEDPHPLDRALLSSLHCSARDDQNVAPNSETTVPNNIVICTMNYQCPIHGVKLCYCCVGETHRCYTKVNECIDQCTK